MATSAQFASTVKSPSVALSVANANRDGATGTYAILMTAGASGSRIDRLVVQATGITTAGMIRLFLGTALIAEIPVLASTPSATISAWAANVAFDGGLLLQAAAALKASTEKGEGFVLTVTNGGDF